MHENANSEVRDTLLMAGGIALAVLGAGMILTHPGIRRALLGGASPLGSLGNGIGGVLPDVERYLKLKAM
jgi:hypothetical protein